MFEFVFLFSSAATANTGEKRIIEAETAKSIGDVSKISDGSAYLVNNLLPAAECLAGNYVAGLYRC